MPIIVTDHAITRYIERVKPLLTFEQAEKELHELAKLAKKIDIPEGHGLLDEGPYLVLSDGIYAPYHNRGNKLRILSVLVRAGKSPGRRAYKKRKRRTTVPKRKQPRESKRLRYKRPRKDSIFDSEA